MPSRHASKKTKSRPTQEPALTAVTNNCGGLSDLDGITGGRAMNPWLAMASCLLLPKEEQDRLLETEEPMSHAMGAVRFDSDGLIMYFEYNGTSDYGTTRLHETEDGVRQHWRAENFEDNYRYCECNRPEKAVALTTHGSGYHWPITACRHCRAIVGEFPPWSSDDAKKGYPDWSPWESPWEVQSPSQLKRLRAQGAPEEERRR